MEISNSKIPYFLYFYYLIVFSLLIFLISSGENKSYLQINSFHIKSLDNIMKIITNLGNGMIIIVLILLFVFYRIRFSIYLISTWFFAGMISQFFKIIVFYDKLRPAEVFKELGVSIYNVKGINIHHCHSFPSGHTATAFAVFFGIALFVKNRALGFCMVLIASFVGFSRIYLGQHFLSDVIAGSIIGVLSSIILFGFISNWNYSWMDKSIIEIIKKRNDSGCIKSA